ncbi:MAG: hypothetical protein GY710_08565, partial [Desulfobacteraceae bacterium]|nr:hypothetical protein [Desulfobacteraceae bacterium]
MKNYKILFSILFILVGIFTTPLIADEYSLDAQNQADGSISVSFDLLVTPELIEVKKNKQKFSYFKNLTNFNKSTQKGYPEVLSKQVPLLIDPDKDYTLRIVESEYETYHLTSPYLVGRGIITRNQDPNTIPYIIDNNSIGLDSYPNQRIESEEHFLIRNVRGFNFKFNITEFNTSLNTIKVYTHLKFKLVPELDSAQKNVSALNNEVVSELYGILPRLFLNYEYDSITSMYRSSGNGEILVIYTSRDYSAIQPYINHKQSMGFSVSTIQVATGTNVKSTIQNAYNQNPNIFYVQLVGDWNDIKSDLGTSQNAPMDPMLGFVSGNDNYADVVIGRFSAEDSSQVTIQVDKTITYEQNSIQSYWSNGLGIASGEGPGDDGELDYEHVDIIKENKLLSNQYSSVKELYSSGSASEVASYINSGMHVINYTGHGSSSSWGTSGFSSSDVNNLSNGNMLPIILSVACLNGTFHYSSTSFAEYWLRKKNGGAVASLMATISQPWSPPMIGQDYMNDLLTGGYDYSSNPGNGTSTTQGKSTFGEIILNAFILWYAESSSTSDLDTISTWTIFGDSSLNVVGGGSSGDCSAPTMNVTDISSSSISVSWNNAGANSYKVYYLKSGGSSWT